MQAIQFFFCVCVRACVCVCVCVETKKIPVKLVLGWLDLSDLW